MARNPNRYPIQPSNGGATPPGDDENESNVADYRGFVERQQRGVDQSAAQEPASPELQIADQGVREQADALIAHHYHAIDKAHILYAFERKEHRRGGRTLPGAVRKLDPVARFLESGKEDVNMGADFIVLIARSQWLAHTDGRWRTAALDHLLAYCGAETNEDGNTSYHLNVPDYSGFLGVLERNGAWNDETAAVVSRAKQLPLFADEAAEGD